MHLFNPKQCLDIANGKNFRTPEYMRKLLRSRSTLNRPIHMSEITVTSPDNNERGLMIQAIITRNYYRLWFSMEKVMGITWWNTVDGCGFKGEPVVSGIFTRDMKEKPVYWALDELINRFSVEVVNKQFYNEIALAFTKLVGGQRDVRTFEKELNLYGVTDQNKYAEFAVRLIGRIVFCWFLKEKKSEKI